MAKGIGVAARPLSHHTITAKECPCRELEKACGIYNSHHPFSNRSKYKSYAWLEPNPANVKLSGFLECCRMILSLLNHDSYSFPVCRYSPTQSANTHPPLRGVQSNCGLAWMSITKCTVSSPLFLRITHTPNNIYSFIRLPLYACSSWHRTTTSVKSNVKKKNPK